MEDERFEYDPGQLNLEHTLKCGQAFRWTRKANGTWVGVVRGAVIEIRQEVQEFAYKTIPRRSDFSLLKDYFKLPLDLQAIYAELLPSDPNVAEAIQRFPGLRVVRQEPEECLFSFVCSTANSISRISRSIQDMSDLYGERIGEIAGVEYHAFPTPERLAGADVDELNSRCGLEWRGANVRLVAEQIVRRPASWLLELRQESYEAAKSALMELRGVGPKIADAVCLFALDKDEAVPVDLHIWRVTQKLYRPDFRGRSLTPKIYETVGDYWRERFGRYAGWAQQYLYYADVLASRRPE
ncbi:MAG: 8-oxoguanine DNA glycosylase [Chloroflexi bacterium]|nr:8-oxoguanine DNA glycosylase [Chloroflexota bacterium]